VHDDDDVPPACPPLPAKRGVGVCLWRPTGPVDSAWRAAGGGWRVAPTAAALSRSGRRVAPTAAALSRSGRPFADRPWGNAARNDATTRGRGERRKRREGREAQEGREGARARSVAAAPAPAPCDAGRC